MLMDMADAALRQAEMVVITLGHLRLGSGGLAQGCLHGIAGSQVCRLGQQHPTVHCMLKPRLDLDSAVHSEADTNNAGRIC